MRKTYYLFNPGRLSRKDNTLKFVAIDQNGQEQSPKYIPVEGVSDLYIYGSLDANSSLYNFLARNRISVHFFDYYEHYTGSFMPKDYLLAGKMQVEQTLAYHSKKRRQDIACRLIDGASSNMLKNLRYYMNRNKELDEEIEKIEAYRNRLVLATDIPELMGIEGNVRQTYYQAFDKILSTMPMEGRTKQPPLNEINTLISFGNMMCYTLCLDMIYHTQLNPTISFLHEPGTRRYSLALDIAEVFKPLLVDRVIFRVVNKKEIQSSDFDIDLNKCILKDRGKKIFIRAFEERLSKTILHRVLKKKISYKHLVKLECYKLTKHILNMEEYKPFKIWW